MNSTATIPVSEITEESVIAFLRSAAAKLAAKTGVDYACVKVELNHNYQEAQWGTYVDGGTHCTGKTLDEAIAAQCVEMGPQARARRMRERAQEILREAEKLEASAS